MSELMTEITLPGSEYSGFGVWGRKTADEMIAMVRWRGEQLKKEGEEILAAMDEEFRIEVVRGPHARHHVATIQESKRKEPPTGTYPTEPGGARQAGYGVRGLERIQT